jgi:hypothetical protein
MFIDNRPPAACGISESNLRGCNQGIFSFGGKMAEPLPNGRGFCHCGDRNFRFITGASLSLATRLERRSCVEVKVPVFLRCTGKPSSANVTSVLYARQRHRGPPDFNWTISPAFNACAMT